MKLTEERIRELAEQLCDVETDFRGRFAFCFDNHGLMKFARAIEAELQPEYTGTCGPLHSFGGEALTPAEVQERLQPVQEPVSFYIYKETAPRLNLPNVVIYALPWVYDQDPSSGFSARLKVYLAPPDQTAEIERLKSSYLKLYEDAGKLNRQNCEIVANKNAEIERLREENRQWKEGGYTSLWKQRTEDRDRTLEMQRCTLLDLRERITTLEAENARLHKGWSEANVDRLDKSDRIDTLEAALRYLEGWVESAPHGDNCFVSDHYDGDPGNRCNCGKESALTTINKALGEE